MSDRIESLVAEWRKAMREREEAYRALDGLYRLTSDRGHHAAELAILDYLVSLAGEEFEAAKEWLLREFPTEGIDQPQIMRLLKMETRT